MLFCATVTGMSLFRIHGWLEIRDKTIRTYRYKSFWQLGFNRNNEILFLDTLTFELKMFVLFIHRLYSVECITSRNLIPNFFAIKEVTFADRSVPLLL